MSSEFDGTYDIGDIPMSCTAISSKTGSKAKDMNDIQPLLMTPEKKKTNKFDWNIWNAPIISGFISFKHILGRNFGKAIYVLFVLTICFMLAQVIANISMWLLGVTSSNMQREQQWGPGDGTGTEYDFLAGPVFATMSILCTLPTGYIVDKKWISREQFLSLSCFIWSASTALIGYSNEYWQVVIYRMVLAMSTATAQPLCASIISDFYPSQILTSAMAIFNFGIYIGFSITYGAGNYISEQYSWRYSWYLFGGIGIALSLIILCLPKHSENDIQKVKDSEHATSKLMKSNDTMSQNSKVTEAVTVRMNVDDDNDVVTIHSVIKYYVQTPSLIILLIASLYRNCGGYTWGYQANNFLEIEKGQSKEEIAKWMGWIPAVAGSIGCLLGGALSDRLAVKYGDNGSKSTVTIRIWILVIASLISGPLAAGTLILDAPYCYWSLFAMYFFSEMWIAITVTIVAELSPLHLKSTLLSIYYFVIAWAGYSPQLITPIANVVGYFWAIFILWPGVYTSVSLLFFLVIFTYKRDLKRRNKCDL